MLWVAPSGKDTATDALEKRLWDAADRLRANSNQFSDLTHLTTILRELMLMTSNTHVKTNA